MNNMTALVKELRETTGASFLDCKQALTDYNGDLAQAAAFLRQKNVTKAAKKADRDTAEGLVVVKSQADQSCLVTLNCETDFVALNADFKTLAHQLAELVAADATLTDAAQLVAATLPTTGQPIQEALRAHIGTLGENIQLGAVGRYVPTASTFVHGYVHAGAISGYGDEEGRFGALVELSLGDKAAIPAAAVEAIAHDLALHIAAAAPKYVAAADIPADVVAQQRAALWEEVALEDRPEAIKERIVNGRLDKFFTQNCLLAQPLIKDESLAVGDWLAAKSKECGTTITVKRFVRGEAGKPAS